MGEESWSQRVDNSVPLSITEAVPGWPEVANRVIKATPPNILVNWKLMWRDPQPNWVSPGGRVVQLGDAAHTFLPTSGNGGTQAMEDAISLAACLDFAGRDDVPSASRVHNLLRFERVSCLQALGVVNQHNFTAKADVKNTTQKKPQMHFGKWIVEHDPEHYAYDNYHKALDHLQTGAVFKNSNTPQGLVYRPWTIDGLLKASEKGEPTILDGDWS
jgi:2-polyprenyl-6-methoxyphenol hydroxylase-like FAD-dependent oxidoreductase